MDESSSSLSSVPNKPEHFEVRWKVEESQLDVSYRDHTSQIYKIDFSQMMGI